jgi:AcrR family transcriptional regulator
MVRIVKKSAERKSDIVKAAKDLFQSKDYDKTTMQDVMSRLGIAKGTIYHYFKSKEELLEAVIENIVDENLEQMQILLKEIKGNALEKIQALVEKGNIAKDNTEILEHLHKPGNDAMHIRLLAAHYTLKSSNKVAMKGFFRRVPRLSAQNLFFLGFNF